MGAAVVVAVAAVAAEFALGSVLILEKTMTRRTFVDLVKRRVIPKAHQRIEEMASAHP